MTDDADTLERIVPHALSPGDVTGLATLELHLARYRWAHDYLPSGRVLDLACGVGYGAKLLAESGAARRVIGADLSSPALGIARRHYAATGVQLVQGDGAAWLRSGVFSGVVSLETVEHVEDPVSFFAELVRVLAPGGVLIASAPVTPSVDANPHHRTDFTMRRFRALGARHGLAAIAELHQRQPYAPWRVLQRKEARTKDLRPNLVGYYAAHPSAAVRRLLATLRYGFTNRYLTIAWRKR